MIALTAGLLALAGLGGCREQPPARPAPTTAPVLDSPEAAARTLIARLKILREARAHGDQAAAEALLAELMGLAARDRILARYEARYRQPPSDPEETLAKYVRGWGPLVGFYIDGIDESRLLTPQLRPGQTEADVLVPVQSEGPRTTIRIQTALGDNGQWRIDRIDFARMDAPGATTFAPASPPPATSPAAPPVVSPGTQPVEATRPAPGIPP